MLAMYDVNTIYKHGIECCVCASSIYINNVKTYVISLIKTMEQIFLKLNY